MNLSLRIFVNPGPDLHKGKVTLFLTVVSRHICSLLDDLINHAPD